MLKLIVPFLCYVIYIVAYLLAYLPYNFNVKCAGGYICCWGILAWNAGIGRTLGQFERDERRRCWVGGLVGLGMMWGDSCGSLVLG